MDNSKSSVSRLIAVPKDVVELSAVLLIVKSCLYNGTSQQLAQVTNTPQVFVERALEVAANSEEGWLSYDGNRYVVT